MAPNCGDEIGFQNESGIYGFCGNYGIRGKCGKYGKCGIRGQKCKYHAGMYGVSCGYLRGIMRVSCGHLGSIVRGVGIPIAIGSSGQSQSSVGSLQWAVLSSCRRRCCRVGSLKFKMKSLKWGNSGDVVELSRCLLRGCLAVGCAVVNSPRSTVDS